MAFLLATAALALGALQPARAQAGGFYKTFCYGSGALGSVGVDCPCGNNVPNGTLSGCANRTGNGAVLDPTGNASVSQDTLVLTASGAPAGAHGFFFSGQSQRSSAVLGNGVRCIDPPFVRLSKVAHTSTQDSIPVPNAPTLSQQLNASAGDTMFFQFIYRDLGGPCAGGANASNAVLVIWGP